MAGKKMTLKWVQLSLPSITWAGSCFHESPLERNIELSKAMGMISALLCDTISIQAPPIRVKSTRQRYHFYRSEI